MEELWPEDYEPVKLQVEREGSYRFRLENGLPATIYASDTEQTKQITRRWKINHVKSRNAFTECLYVMESRGLELRSGWYPIIEVSINRGKLYLTFCKTDLAWVVWVLKHHLKLAFCAEHVTVYADQAYESISRTCKTLDQAIVEKIEPSIISLLVS